MHLCPASYFVREIPKGFSYKLSKHPSTIPIIEIAVFQAISIIGVKEQTVVFMGMRAVCCAGERGVVPFVAEPKTCGCFFVYVGVYSYSVLGFL